MESTFNATNVKSFRKDFDQAMKQLQETYGVDIQLGTIRFTDMKFSSKLTVTKTGTNRSGKTADQISFERNAFFVGLENEDFNREFTDRGITYKIVGINPRARKNPILLETTDGKKYSANSTMIKRLLEGTKIITNIVTSNIQSDDVKQNIFANNATQYGLDRTYWKAIYTGPSGGKYHLIGFEKGKGILQKVGTEETCKLDMKKVVKSLVRTNILIKTGQPKL